MNVLLIGALPPPVGGTTVLFKQLVDDLHDRDDICIRVIDISRPTVGKISNFIHALRCLVLLFWNLRWSSVLTFHTSLKGVIFFGPVVHVASRLFQRKWIVRGFGGDIDTWHRNTRGVRRRVFDLTVLHADALLLERKISVQYFQNQSEGSVLWYPNSRHCGSGVTAAAPGGTVGRRFVFVGHVKPSKGIVELIEAAKMLSITTSMAIDVYGPLLDGISNSWFAGSPVNYRGSIANKDVIQTLTGYDVLVLPTYAQIEGYPGVILEAYCAGIPVITTRWGGIPEIVTAETGILVEPRDVAGLAKAMQMLIDSDQLLATLRDGARSKAAEFDAKGWTQYFVDLCQRVSTD
jgi:glycosyltransferase involved in cell wall biosynthesis